MNERQPDDLIEAIVEVTWRELKGQVPRSRICEIVAELVDRYEDVKVKAYLPILIHRQVVDLLNAEREIAISDIPVEHPAADSGQKVVIGQEFLDHYDLAMGRLLTSYLAPVLARQANTLSILSKWERMIMPPCFPFSCGLDCLQLGAKLFYQERNTS